MDYPSMMEVNAADREQLARWHRFLPTPGLNATMEAISEEEMTAAMDIETGVLMRIVDRFRGLGGMTPEISKQIDNERQPGR